MSHDWVSMVYVFDRDFMSSEIISLLSRLCQNGWGKSEDGQYQCVYWDGEGLNQGRESIEKIAQIFTDINTNSATISLQYGDTDYEIRMGFSRDPTDHPEADYTHIEVKSLHLPLQCENDSDSSHRREWFLNALVLVAQELKPRCGYGSNGPEAAKYKLSESEFEDGIPDQVFDIMYFNNNIVDAYGDDSIYDIESWSTRLISNGGALFVLTPPGQTQSEPTYRSEFAKEDISLDEE